jgi:hypothetical protein
MQNGNNVQYSTTSFIFLSLVAKIERGITGIAVICWLADGLF